MENNQIGLRIKKMRTDNDWTQKDLANKLGLKNDTAIANYESGYSIPKDEIKFKMCKLFNCSLDYLMGKSFYKNNKEHQLATNYTIEFLKSESASTIKIINILLSQLIDENNNNLYYIEKLIYNQLQFLGCPHSQISSMAIVAKNLYEAFLQTRH